VAGEKKGTACVPACRWGQDRRSRRQRAIASVAAATAATDCVGEAEPLPSVSLLPPEYLDCLCKHFYRLTCGFLAMLPSLLSVGQGGMLLKNCKDIKQYLYCKSIQQVRLQRPGLATHLITCLFVMHDDGVDAVVAFFVKPRTARCLRAARHLVRLLSANRCAGVEILDSRAVALMHKRGELTLLVLVRVEIVRLG
jgi:hypothetical protein